MYFMFYTVLLSCGQARLHFEKHSHSTLLYDARIYKVLR